MELAAQLTATPQPLVTSGLRFAAAAIVAVVLAVVWIAAEHESHSAVRSTGWAISVGPGPIKLPTVEIVGRRAA